MMKCLTIFLISATLTPLSFAQTTGAADGKLKIFILAGQSNMVGFGQVNGDAPGTMQTLLKQKPKDYRHLVSEDGTPLLRNDVWLVDISSPKEEKQGWLGTDFGAQKGYIGPEYGFGWQVGNFYQDPVLLIKSAWGGRSLFHNFLPPSSEKYPKPKKDGDKGFQYAEILRHFHEITNNLKKYYPEYQGQGYELVGFGWHQGWNDRINAQAVDAYEKNIVNFIKDIRQDLNAANLPFVIANTGIGGWNLPKRYQQRVEKHMNSQLAPADPNKYPDFAGNVAAVETRDFHRSEQQSPSKQGFHWMRNWETYYLIGTHLGKEMNQMLLSLRKK